MTPAQKLIESIVEMGPISRELLDYAYRADATYYATQTSRGLKFSFATQQAASNFWDRARGGWTVSGVEDDRSTYGRWCVYVKD